MPLKTYLSLLSSPLPSFPQSITVSWNLSFITNNHKSTVISTLLLTSWSCVYLAPLSPPLPSLHHLPTSSSPWSSFHPPLFTSNDLHLHAFINPEKFQVSPVSALAATFSWLYDLHVSQIKVSFSQAWYLVQWN